MRSLAPIRRRQCVPDVWALRQNLSMRESDCWRTLSGMSRTSGTGRTRSSLGFYEDFTSFAGNGRVPRRQIRQRQGFRSGVQRGASKNHLRPSSALEEWNKWITATYFEGPAEATTRVRDGITNRSAGSYSPGMARGEPTKTIAHVRAAGEKVLTVHCLGPACHHQAQPLWSIA